MNKMRLVKISVGYRKGGPITFSPAQVDQYIFEAKDSTKLLGRNPDTFGEFSFQVAAADL